MKKLLLTLLALAALAAIVPAPEAWGSLDINFDIHPIFFFPNPRDVENSHQYQLRSVSAPKDGHTFSGSQWFATILENWFSRVVPETATSTRGYRAIYRRTLGGESPVIPMTTSADLLHDHEHIFIDEPQPYPYYPDTIYRDRHLDPIESMFLVIPDGSGQLSIRMANDWARHYPHWKTISGDLTTSDDLRLTSGDLQTVQEEVNITGQQTAALDYYSDYRDLFPSNHYEIAVSPKGPQTIAPKESMKADFTFRAQDPDRYGSTLQYVTFKQSASFDVGYQGYRESLKIPLVVANVFNGPASVPGHELYFDVTVKEDPGRWLDKDKRRTRSRALADDDKDRENRGGNNDSTGHGEIAPIGPDDLTGDVVNRFKFRWNVNEPLTHDLGTFYFAAPYFGTMPNYILETRITNRTGVRYRLFRYDIPALPVHYDRYRSIEEIHDEPDEKTRPLPPWVADPRVGGTSPYDATLLYWAYDVTPDLYGTLPRYFHLDFQSEIAPGLVTVYGNRLDLTHTTNSSFRLYPDFTPERPMDLVYRYDKVTSMRLSGSKTSPTDKLTENPYIPGQEEYWGYRSGGPNYRYRWRLRAFDIDFVDDSDLTGQPNTKNTLKKLMGLPPQTAKGFNFSEGTGVRLGLTKTAQSPFRINEAVTVPLSMDVEVVEKKVASGDGFITVSEDKLVPAEIALLPVEVRFRISRHEDILRSHWKELVEAKDNEELLDRFTSFATVWVVSPETAERRANLSSAQGRDGALWKNCARAFTYDDALYLEFFVFIADAKSPKKNKTAYTEVFWDDNIPYMLIGDGKQDGRWDLTFYVDRQAGNPEGYDPGKAEAHPRPTGGQEGGGCSAGFSALSALALTALLPAAGGRRKKR